VRSLLIQIQKVKVDGALAMSALDKLLQSNELNFAFLAFIPTLLVTYSVVNYFKSAFGVARKHATEEVARNIKLTMRDIEKLVLDFDRSSDETIGLLLCHLVSIDQTVRESFFSERDRVLLLEDVEDLEQAIMDERKDSGVILTIMNRIYRFL
jgi:nuclear control of ATPase protein 2